MRILLISPPYAASEPPRIPMGLLYIGGKLLELGHEVKALDLLVRKATPEKIKAAIEEFDPELVGITSVTMNFPEASAILRYIKELNPKIKTVFGGPHATFCWQEISEQDPWIDIVVQGEGEETIKELVAELKNGGDLSKVAGIAYRDGGVLKSTGSRPLIDDLDALPMAARGLFPVWLYRILRTDGGLTTGRGCPFSCIFCVGPKMVGRKPRLRSPKLVVDELEDLIRMGFDGIALSDDHFAMNRRHAFDVCDEIIARGIKTTLNIFVRADSIDTEILQKMYDAGCRRVLFGVESGVQEIVDRIKKKQSLDMVKEKVKLTKSMGIDVQASFIMGLPGESAETLSKTFEYARSLGTFYGMHVLAPLPGSELFEKADEYGLTIHHKDWKRYDANQAIASTKSLASTELDRIAAEYDGWFEKMAALEVEQDRLGKLMPDHHDFLERRRSQAFFWRILREDFIDDYKPNGAKGTSAVLSDMAAKAAVAAQGMDVNSGEAERWLQSLIDERELKWDDKAGRYVFTAMVYPEARKEGCC